ncbi:hypothetical protein B0A48_03493 [Cryoendolithus antarcticus]|uniref:Uncharacterized protein n=1 Tax=Cryoendolithus antarcticus TaxID=1507870 RepID=A0A1V8TK67_9PEZI|nr:hypothetical protein B0A48_03493 [Cryoendolithus antarcticus]
MASPTLLDTLSSLQTSSDAAFTSLPQLSTLLPPENGIALLDAKTEIFLSYLQALALRNLTVLRGVKEGADAEETKQLSDRLTNKLIEHRVYLERGVRPLEQRIKYEVDRNVRMAEDDDRKEAMKAKQPAAATKGHGSDSESDSDEEDEDETNTAENDAFAVRPNPSAMLQRNNDSAAPSRTAASSADGVYRPPRVSATSMPTTESRAAKPARVGRSSTVDEYISSELSLAPTAQPSIGSTITSHGRGTKNSRDMAREAERRDYEETNLVRLPKESKKILKAREEKQRGSYGGEEWRGIGESVDRIAGLTGRKGGKEGVLERSRKRPTEDGPRGDGVQGGGAFEVKKRRVEKRAKR